MPDGFRAPRTHLTKHLVPPQTYQSKHQRELLERYVIEIIAMTFNVDFDTLNTALYRNPVSGHTTTILTEKEGKDLEELARLVLKAHTCSHVHDNDKVALRKTVIGPAEDIDFQLGAYALELVG